MANETHRWTGDHPVEVAVGDKRVWLAPGGFVKFGKNDVENEDNTVVFENGNMMDLSEFKASSNPTGKDKE